MKRSARPRTSHTERVDAPTEPAAAHDGGPSGARTPPNWPHVEYEEHDWVGSIDIPRRWQSTFSGPYRAAVVPEIARLDPVLPVATTALADEATAELARFDAEMGSEISPFGAILLRSESAASSRIEHLTASATSIALAELGDTSRHNATEIVANTTAMTAAIELADRLDASAILAMHDALLGRHDPNVAGKWRTGQVWIGSSNYGPHTASFVPPRHTRVTPAIDDLVKFMQRNDLPVLVQAAIAHAQFETIHPFPDGNGRTGRALVHCLLRGKRLTRQVTVPVSAGLLTDTGRYFAALTAYRDGDVESIVGCFAEASFDSIVNGRQLVDELHHAAKRMERVDSPAGARRPCGGPSASCSSIRSSTTLSCSENLASRRWEPKPRSRSSSRSERCARSPAVGATGGTPQTPCSLRSTLSPNGPGVGRADDLPLPPSLQLEPFYTACVTGSSASRCSSEACSMRGSHISSMSRVRSRSPLKARRRPPGPARRPSVGDRVP